MLSWLTFIGVVGVRGRAAARAGGPVLGELVLRVVLHDLEQLEVGAVVVFPAFEYHRVTPLRSGVKYGLVVRFELPTF